MSDMTDKQHIAGFGDVSIKTEGQTAAYDSAQSEVPEGIVVECRPRRCECGSMQFRVYATCIAVEEIVIDEDDPSEFDYLDTDYGDVEWEPDSEVHCERCHKVIRVRDWEVTHG